MKVFIFLAEGFEEVEAVATIDVLRRASIHITTVSITGSKQVTGAHNIPVVADLLFTEADFSTADMYILPGGMPGTKHLDEFNPLKKLIKLHAEKEGKIAAICAAPGVLGKMGLLDGKEVICYPGFEDQLHNSVLSKKSVVKSANFITAKGPGVAIQFALKIIAELKGEEKAEEVAHALYLN